MNIGYYGLILLIPPFACLAIVIITFCVLKKLQITMKKAYRLTALYAFPDFIKKTENNEATRYMFIDVYLEDGSDLLLAVFKYFANLFYFLFLAGVYVFFQFLLIDISHSCNLEDKNKDCFEFKLGETISSPFSKEPIDCSSYAVQNVTVEVECFKIVFNAGTAMGASYGTFKISMAVINLVATVMLMIKNDKTIDTARVILGFLYLSLLAGKVAIQFTTLRVHMPFDVLVKTLQDLLAVGVGLNLAVLIPWKAIINLKKEQNNQQELDIDGFQRRDEQAMLLPETTANYDSCIA